MPIRVATNLMLFMALISSQFAVGQRSKGTPSLVWPHEIHVKAGTIRYQDSTLQGFTFTVYETDAKTLMRIWQNDHAPISSSFAKGTPAAALNANVPAFAAGPVTVIASAKGDKRAGSSDLTIAFKGNGSVELPSMEKQQAHVRDLAVKYNRAVVQEQIIAQEKIMAASTGKLDKRVAKDEKLTKQIARINNQLVKTQNDRMKEQSRNAELQSAMVTAEQRASNSGSTKDLDRLSKSREKLTKGESRVLKLMERESKLHAQLDKASSYLPENLKEKEGQMLDVDSNQRTLDALRTKLTSIR